MQDSLPEKGPLRWGDNKLIPPGDRTVASAEKLAIIISMTYNDLLLTLLVRLTEPESLTEHRPLVRTASVCSAQRHLKISASPLWSWPHALGEREVGGGGGFVSAARPRDAQFGPE